MTLPEKTDSDREFDRREPWRTRERVDLAPAHRCVDVIACCGPDGDRIMIDTYIDRGALFLDVAEAVRLSAAISRAANRTHEASVSGIPTTEGTDDAKR